MQLLCLNLTKTVDSGLTGILGASVLLRAVMAQRVDNADVMLILG